MTLTILLALKVVKRVTLFQGSQSLTDIVVALNVTKQVVDLIPHRPFSPIASYRCITLIRTIRRRACQSQQLRFNYSALTLTNTKKQQHVAVNLNRSKLQ